MLLEEFGPADGGAFLFQIFHSC